MKNILLSFIMSLLSLMAVSQIVIKSDTNVTKTVVVGESFELHFLDTPGVGQIWTLSKKADSANIEIKLTKSVVMKGSKGKGGDYVSTYYYKCLKKGCYQLRYVYSGHGIKEKYCNIKINVK